MEVHFGPLAWSAFSRLVGNDQRQETDRHPNSLRATLDSLNAILGITTEPGRTVTIPLRSKAENNIEFLCFYSHLSSQKYQ
jgi:hypothetical protein